MNNYQWNDELDRVGYIQYVQQDTVTGLGDLVKKITDKLGIKLDNCDCEQRRKLLNKLVPFGGHNARNST